MKKLSFNSITRKQQPNGVSIEAIWKYWHRHVSISIVTGNGIAKKIIFAIKIFFFFKVEYSFLWLIMVSVPLWYKYSVLYDFLSIKSKTSIGVLEKSFLNIRKHPSWIKKKTAPKISAYFAYFPAKHPRLSVLVGLPRITPKSSLEQLFCRHEFIRAI